MKIAIASIVAFVTTTLATTVIVVVLAPPPEVAPDPTEVVALADSTPDVADSVPAALEPAQGDSVIASAAPVVEAGPLEPDVPVETETAPAATVDAAPPVPALPVAVAPPVPPVAAPTGPSPAEKEEALQALARIFGQMRPAEAAEVLRHMSDEEVEGVVRNLGSRKAAAVLINLPEQRAAELARRLLIPLNEGQR